MRKKDLINQNMSLFEEIQRYKLEITRLNRTLTEKDSQIAHLKEELNQAKRQVAEPVSEETEPQEAAEESTCDERLTVRFGEDIVCDEDTEYGACAIGELVVISAEYSNKLTENGEVSYKELLNLILGRNEVAKSEILTIVSRECDFEEKKALIDEVKAKTLEYFESVMAQIA